MILMRILIYGAGCDWILGELPNDDIYDFVLLTVRENQLYEALTELKNNKK